MTIKAKRPSTCAGCKFAEWDRTASGALHPKGAGKCRHPFILGLERQQAEANERRKAELVANGESRRKPHFTASVRYELPVVVPMSVTLTVTYSPHINRTQYDHGWGFSEKVPCPAREAE